jgi:hypothetical protein
MLRYVPQLKEKYSLILFCHYRRFPVLVVSNLSVTDLKEVYDSALLRGEYDSAYKTHITYAVVVAFRQFGGNHHYKPCNIWRLQFPSGLRLYDNPDSIRWIDVMKADPKIHPRTDHFMIHDIVSGKHENHGVKILIPGLKNQLSTTDSLF